MACFLVPAAEAAVTAIAQKKVENKETAGTESSVPQTGIPFARKLAWLRNLLLGGSVLLMFEHVWHGEIVPYFPFLTAAQNPSDMEIMLHEMATVGVAMAVLITVVWLCMLAVAAVYEKRQQETAEAEE